MRKALSYLLVLTLVFPCVIKLGMIVNYTIQFNYYSTVLCENKDKPELKCNGVCHLTKELQSVTDEKSDDTSNLPEELRVDIAPIIVMSNENILLGFEFQSKRRFSEEVRNNYRLIVVHDIFHPPV